MDNRSNRSRRGVLASLMAAVALPASAQRPPSLGTTEAVSISLAEFGVSSGRLALPLKIPAPGILIVHDGFGATAEMQRLAQLMAFEGFPTVAIDLFRGKTATSDAEAAQLARTALDAVAARRLIAMWADWLRSRPYCDRRMAAVAFGPSAPWLMGAGLDTSITPMVYYYGRVVPTEDELRRLPTRALAHFADRDKIASPAVRADFERRMTRGGKFVTIHGYSGGAGFANPLSKAYDKADAALAWIRTTMHLRETLGVRL